MGLEFFFILLVISALYSSVGHGGASGYLALMAIYCILPEVMKPTALILNLFVAGISFVQFYRNGYFRPGLFWLFALNSIPAAFLGGMIQLDPVIYKRVLGVLLIFTVLRMTGVFGIIQTKDGKSPKRALALVVGFVIGFFSGIIGIGGGIILSPLLLLLGWGDTKETAAVSALFIWINSFAGLMGGLASGVEVSLEILPFIGVALAGGAVGGYLGSYRSSEKILRYTLSAVLLMACFKLILF